MWLSCPAQWAQILRLWESKGEFQSVAFPVDAFNHQSTSFFLPLAEVTDVCCSLVETHDEHTKGWLWEALEVRVTKSISPFKGQPADGQLSEKPTAMYTAQLIPTKLSTFKESQVCMHANKHSSKD